ncbi:hypothetical protein P8452_31023 [Trifolium repens]|nr:hypothetical protein P8452_31023 [Trifolium repens]
MLECSLAKPQADQKAGVTNTQNPGLLPSYPPHVGYGLVGNPYGALGAGFGAPGLAQPLMYGPGQTPAGMAMMPMLLADGRIGYVLQQPGLQPHTPPSHQRGGRNDSGSGGGGGGSRNTGSSSKGRHSNDSGQGRRYRPY